MSELKSMIQGLLDLAGIKINGNNAWDIKVYNSKLYAQILSKGSLGLGESYMEGWWDCERLDEFFNRVLRAKLYEKVKMGFLLHVIKSKLTNLQSKSGSLKIGKVHYDVGNDLYERMLDKRLVYTCAYWKDSNNLEEAQEAKLDLICRKLGFKPGMKVLDIGCGWASFAKFAAEKYKVQVVGITISKEQVKLGNELCKGLPVDIRFQDYRDVSEKFDRIVSLGMIEHVGYKNYRNYMKIVNKCLKKGGLFLVQTIGSLTSVKTGEPWLEKYIFPNSMLPSVKQIAKASEGLLVMEDWHNFGVDYDKTLMAWYQNFEKHWNEIKDNYDDKFYRMWKYYLLSCAGSFRSKNIQLWQILFSKNGVDGGYESVR